jgi:imidazolonepropionase-like amidohydrolase
MNTTTTNERNIMNKTQHKTGRQNLIIAIAMALTALTCSSLRAWNPEIPGAPQKGPVAIVGAKIYTVLFENGKITAVGEQVDLPADARKIEGKRLQVYPALFDAYSQLGLTEINSTRSTVDHRELGRIKSNVKAHVAVNPDSELIPVTRANGILLALSAPTGGLISGQSAVLQLDGWTFEDLTLKSRVGMHINWPSQGSIANFSSSGGAGDAASQVAELFDQVDLYKKARQLGGHPIDLRLEAMLPVADGKMPLIVHANSARVIQSAVAFCSARKLKMIVVGGYDAEHCADLLKAHDIPVVISAIHRLPMRRSDAYDAAYTLPERLRQKGVKFCIAGGERFGAPNVRNLPYQAGTAVAYGLPEDEAIKAITLSPAEIYGVADRVGSIEAGKHATLIVTTGSPLETPTRVVHAFIQGRQISLNNKHLRLYRKYQARYETEAVDKP